MAKEKLNPHSFMTQGYIDECNDTNNYIIRSRGCSCCSSEYQLTKTELVELYRDMIITLENEIETIDKEFIGIYLNSKSNEFLTDLFKHFDILNTKEVQKFLKDKKE